LQGLGTAEVGNNVGQNATDASVSSAELIYARDVACAQERRLSGLSKRLDSLVKKVDDIYDQISENELICERTISKIANDMDAHPAPKSIKPHKETPLPPYSSQTWV
jgi:hypothetical protein